MENVYFEYDDSPILRNIYLALDEGEKIALMGENGSGKTTLSLILAGIFKPSKGSVVIDGVSIWDVPEKNFRKKIGYVFQNPEDGFVADSIFRELAFGAENFALPRDEIIIRIKNLIEKFEIDTGKSPLELSGGMKARLSIASALATGAEIFILDEPESFLDLRGKKALISAIDDIAAESTIIHITQSSKIAKNYDSTYFIKNGHLKIANSKSFRKIEPPIESLKMPARGNLLMRLEDISFSYVPRQLKILKSISLEIHQGEVIGLVGSSGSGKTTLALIIAGILKSQKGFIDKKCRVAIAMQFPERQLFADTVMEDVMYGPENLHLPDARISAEKSLEALGIFSELWNCSPFLLSDGQQRRVGIAGVLAVQPDLLILDEPFATLDFDGTIRVIEIIKNFAQSGKAVLIITHNTNILSKIAHRTVAMLNGTIIYDGETKTLLNDKALCERIGIASIDDNYI
ncbi:ABC transporter ATP-binding protein [bacterium]|nr:ABC transporter ATP-binding protein [bacterium]